MLLYLDRIPLPRVTIAAITGILIVNANAQPPQLAWRCTLEVETNVSLLCIPLRAGPAAEGAGHADWAAEPARPGTIGDMRPVADRGGEETFSAPWRVPLYAQPTDLARVNELMRSVLCGKHPACSVDYQAPAPKLARR